ncbi:MAG TPA: hypothetical protein DDZ51_26395, partial [Planctomycetaceae bacterium]|nr:hypothetical protein [Planctomycetaceae bacterium]
MLENLESRQLLAADNAPPMAAGDWIDIQHNAPHQISIANLNYSDADNDPLVSLTVQTLPNLGELQLYGFPVYAGQEIFAWDIHFGSFHYVPASGATESHSVSFSFSVSDGWHSSPIPASLGFHIEVTPNSLPVVTGSTHTLQGNQSRTLTLADFGYSDPDGDPLQTITILNAPSIGTLQYYGYPIYSGQSFYSYEIEWGYLTYVPSSTANATYQDSLTFKANDGFGDSLPATVAYTVNITPNSPPVVTGSMHTLQGNQSRTLTLADFGYSDTDGDALQTITVLNAPTIGTLQYYGFPIYSGQSFYAYEIDWGYLTYVPSPTANATYQDGFTFKADDGFGDSLPATVVYTVNITPNSPPIVTGSTHTLQGNQSRTLTLADFGYSDPDGDVLQTVTIHAVPLLGTLEYYGYPVYSGQTFYDYDILSGHLAYRPDPYNGSAFQDSLTFIASDGNSNSPPATIHFSVTAAGNSTPTTGNTQIAIDASGPLTLLPSYFPYSDADDDIFAHLTILSLPAGGSLKHWGEDVTIGQEISTAELAAGSLQLTLSPSQSGNAATSFSFSVSDGIDSSSAAAFTATHTGTANSRPVTWLAPFTAATGEITFFDSQTFPFEDPDGDSLAHVTIHAFPIGAAIVDASGNEMSLPVTITAAMLETGEVGFLSHAEPETEFGIVFSVNDGHLDSSHNVLAVDVTESDEHTPTSSTGRINFNRLSGPVVVLADGYIPSPKSSPTTEMVARWLDSNHSAGTVVYGQDDQWIYTETLNIGPAFGLNESVEFVFIATGAGTTVTSYSVDITGVHNEAAEQSDEGSGDKPQGDDESTGDQPWLAEQPTWGFPSRPTVTPSLTYRLEVTLGSDGSVTHFNRSGHYHHSYYFALIDEPFTDEAEAGDDEDMNGTYFADGSVTSSDSGAFTIIVAGWTILHFDNHGATVDLGDHVHFSYRGGGSYGYDPLADSIESDDENAVDQAPNNDATQGEQEGQTDGDLPPAVIRSGSVSGTFNYYGLHDYQGSITGRVKLDDTADPLTFTITWIDQIGSAYSGNGSYQDGDTAGTITERGSSHFTDQGSIVLVLIGDDYTLSGASAITAQGDGYFFESWAAPLDSDDEEIAVSGNAMGTLLISYSFNDHFDFDLQPIPASKAGEGDDEDGEFFNDGGEDTEADATSDDDSQVASTHQWAFVGGSFDDVSQFVSTGGYQGSGTFNTTAGTAPDRDGQTRSLDTPVSGSVSLGGNHRSSIILNAQGTFTSDAVVWNVGTLELFASSDSFSIIHASGNIQDGLLSGAITYYDNQQTNFLRDLTFDLTAADLPATGHGHDFVLSDTQFDQVANGSVHWDTMAGVQWANLSDHSYLLISVNYKWANGEINDRAAEPGDDNQYYSDEADEDTAGWQVTTADFVLTLNSSFDIGYDVNGLDTRDGLHGTVTEKAYQSGADGSTVVLKVRPKAASQDGDDSGDQATGDGNPSEHGNDGEQPENDASDQDPAENGDAENDTEVSVEFGMTFRRENYFLASHDLSGSRTSEPMAPSSVVISGTAWDIARNELHSSVNVSASFGDDTEPSVSGSSYLLSQTMVDNGFSGNGVYTRTDGDTTFNGTANHSESYFSNQFLRLLHWINADGQWELGSPPSPNADYVDSRFSSGLRVQYDHNFSAIGTVANDAGNIQWDPAFTSASESGQARHSLYLSFTGTPQEVPPETDDDDDVNQTFGLDDSDGISDGDNLEDNPGDESGDESGDDDTGSPFPKLQWTFGGLYRSDSSFFIQSQRDAVGIYDSGTLAGSVTENFFFRVSAAHDDEFSVQPDGSLEQVSGESAVGSQLQFAFSLSVSGNIDDDHPHSGGLTGTVRLVNRASGGAFFSLDEQFSPSGPNGTWTTDGESFDWQTFNSATDVELNGSVNRNLGGVDTSVSLSHETANHAGGTSASRFTLNTTREADQSPGNDDQWLQMVGISLSDQVARSSSSQSGQSSGGMIDQTTRTRSEHATWSQLYAPETEPGTGHWGDGGKTVDDYFFSLNQSSGQTESLEIPMGDSGNMLRGSSYNTSSHSMLVRSNEGRTLGDGATPPRIDPSVLGGLDGRVALPLRPPGTGSAAPPDADDPDGESDWATGNYGRIRVSQSGNSAAGFELAGYYLVDAGAPVPAQGSRRLSSEYSSGYDFSLTSRKRPADDQWKNIAGSRETTSGWSEGSSNIVSGLWAVTSPDMAVTGVFLDSQIENKSGSSRTESQLDPSSGTWSDIASNGFHHDIDNDRHSYGGGTYSHDRFGFEVSGTITVANEHRYRLHHSTQHIYVNGALSSDSTGDRYTELTTRSMSGSSASGYDNSTSTTSGPFLIPLSHVYVGEPVSNQTITVTRDHTASESNLRDFGSRDRSDWRFDSATGQLVPTQRVQTHNHVIATSLDVTYDTDVDTAFDGNYTLPAAWHAPTPRTYEFDGTSRRRVIETFSSGENSSRTTTSTTPLEGEGAGEAIVLVTGSDAVTHSSYARSDSHSSVYNEQINGSDGYFFQQTTTDDYFRSTFDSHRSTQRIDGTGDTHYQGNRTLSGNGWTSRWTLRQFAEFEPEQGSDHWPLSPEDDSPNSYNVTIDHSAEASADTPIPYGHSTNPPVNTPPAVPAGPGGFATQEDSQAISDLKGQVAMNGSAAASENAARDAAFAELADETETSDDPGDESTTEPPSASSVVSTY